MWTVLTDPYYRKASWVVAGICWANTLSGINVIDFYSTRILAGIDQDSGGKGLTPVQGDAPVY